MPIVNPSIVGKRFGRLEVLRKGVGHGPRNRTTWVCRCDCGSEIETADAYLKSGDTKSCGCLKLESLVLRSKTHSLSKTPTYYTWNNMVQRCTNKNNNRFDDYGGRGITVCDRWLKFESFLADMGIKPEGMTLERNDNNLGYSKANCRWAMAYEQSRNKRTSVLLDVDGQMLTLSEAARLRNIKVNTLWRRISVSGWSLEKALNTPILATPGDTK